jgi:hypothetical protein
MNCDICGRPIKGPPFGAIGECLCWECWSGENLPEDDSRKAPEPLCWECWSGENLPEDDSRKAPEPRLTAMEYYVLFKRWLIPAEKAGKCP